MCAYNVLFENFKFLGLLRMYKKSKKHKFCFTAYSVDVE
jgi:hypothetical protein